MDPLIGLAGTITSLAFKLTTFVRDVRDSRNEIDGVTQELLAVKGVLEIIADDVESSSRPLPSSLEKQLSGVISNCTHVVGEVDRCIRDHEGSRVQKGARWVAFGRGDMARLRSTLEAHKSTLNLAVEMISLTALRDVQQDTTVIKKNTDALVKDSKDLVDGTARILEAIAELQAKFPGTLDGDSRFFMLGRYLDELTSYAETVCDDAEARFEDLTLRSVENSDAESSSSRLTNKATPPATQQAATSGPVAPRLALPDEADDDLHNDAGSLSTAPDNDFRSETHGSIQTGPTSAEGPNDGMAHPQSVLRDNDIHISRIHSSEKESFSMNTVSPAKSLNEGNIQATGKSTLQGESVPTAIAILNAIQCGDPSCSSLAIPNEYTFMRLVSTGNQAPVLSSFTEHLDQVISGERMPAGIGFLWRRLRSVPHYLSPDKLDFYGDESQRIFGLELTESLRRASVPISQISQDDEWSIYGRIPFVVAKCGAFLKEKGTMKFVGEEENPYRQAHLCRMFNTPPWDGRRLVLDNHTCVDVTGVLVRYFALLCCVELASYHRFWDEAKSTLSDLRHPVRFNHSLGKRTDLSELAAGIKSSMGFFCEKIAKRGEPTVALFRYILDLCRVCVPASRQAAEAFSLASRLSNGMSEYSGFSYVHKETTAEVITLFLLTDDKFYNVLQRHPASEVHNQHRNDVVESHTQGDLKLSYKSLQETSNFLSGDYKKVRWRTY